MSSKKIETAIFGGGCFWCMEQPFRERAGVVDVVVGYSGGYSANPDYQLVAGGQSDHSETVRVTYYPEEVEYSALLDIFWRQIDPTDDGGQFADRGNHYRTAIFYTSNEQKKIAMESRNNLDRSGLFSQPVVTQILPATTFYPAEEYHQEYYKKNAVHYSAYKTGSGRAGFIDRVWNQRNGGESPPLPSKVELKKKLTPLQFEVTQNEGTEPPFANEYWDNKEAGIYVDRVSGEVLFSSTDKFDSGTGWPSFTKPLVSENITEKIDRKLLMTRTEVRSRKGNSHLGHVFNDGPAPEGVRYCINSASLQFIPATELEEEGYGEYAGLFQ